MGMDQDNVVLAPVDHHQVPRQRRDADQHEPERQFRQQFTSTSDTVNTLSSLYPVGTSLYPSRSSIQAADYPQPVRFTNVDQIVAKAASATKVSRRSARSRTCCASGTASARRRRRLQHPRHDRDDEDVLATTQSMSVLLLVVALISLVVGGVGIMNIMLVSVTERTREIGLRMAVGARSYHILRQFLVEAVVLCLVGGAMGILLGRGTSILVRWQIHWPTRSVAVDDRRRRGGLCRRRRRLRLLSRLESLAAGPDRSPAVRMIFGERIVTYFR